MNETKRITVSVDKNIDTIRDHLYATSGVEFTYVQLFDHLIHFYMKHANEPKTQWRPLQRSHHEN